MADDAAHEGVAVEPAAPRQALNSIPRWVGIGLFIYATIYTLSYAKSFFVPVILGLLLSLVFGPIRRVFDRRGVPPALTAFGIVAALLFGTLAIAGALSVPVTGWVERAPEISQAIRAQLVDLSGATNGLFEAGERLRELTGGGADGNQVAVRQTNYAASILSMAPGVLTQFVFTLVLLFFLLASGDMFYEKLVHVLPRFEDKRRAMKMAHDIERKLSRYLLTITVINAGLGCAVGAAMWLLGMPSPFVFGVIAFVFNYVPYLGALFGIGIATAVALVSFDWIGWAAIVGGVYFVVTSVEGQFVTPHFVGRSLKLNTVMVFLAVSFWAWLWSAIGMIVAVPLLASLRVLCFHIEGMGGLGDFLSERHAEK